MRFQSIFAALAVSLAVSPAPRADAQPSSPSKQPSAPAQAGALSSSSPQPPPAPANAGALPPSKKSPAPARAGAPPPTAIDPARLRAHVAFLADDLVEGRGPGTRGGLLAEKYVAATMATLGLQPGAGDGTFLQAVPLVGVTRRPESAVGFMAGGSVLTPTSLEEVVDWTNAQKEVVDGSGPLVFVGYGVEAPEYGWDDFKGVDVKGKFVLMLANDPPATEAEPDLFKGKALTYYGRWTYKFESAARHGAAGAYLVHTDASAGYGWDVVRNSWSGEQSQNRLDTTSPSALRAAGWLSEPFARKLLTAAGQDFDALRASAATRAFRPVDLKVAVTLHLGSSLRPFEAHNVIGFLPGRDPAKAGETVLVSAHLDHFGIGRPDESGDAIYNGAVDDASGVATLLEVARVLAASGGVPRPVTFAAVTAEEQGLKGSAWLAAHPITPPGRTAACVNLDGGKPWGAWDDYVLMGAERSPELFLVAKDVAAAMHFVIKPDLHPEQGFFYRSDHFSFAKVGIPCINVESGEKLRGKPEGTGAKLAAAYDEKRYHRPADQLDDTWDFAGFAQYGEVAAALVRRIAALPALPGWNTGDEFLAARLESQKK